MAHHLLVAVVLLSACLILVVDATSKPNAEESKKVDGAASGSNPSVDALGELIPPSLKRLKELEPYLGELETLLVSLRNSDGEEFDKTFQSFQEKLTEAQAHINGLSKA